MKDADLSAGDHGSFIQDLGFTGSILGSTLGFMINQILF